MKGSAVALFSVNLMYSVNFMSVKVHCTFNVKTSLFRNSEVLGKITVVFGDRKLHLTTQYQETGNNLQNNRLYTKMQTIRLE